MGDIFKCILCGEYYQTKDLGKLNCYAHPYQINALSRVYPCCNLPRAVITKGNPNRYVINGCTRIDHISSIEELKFVVNSPWVILPFENPIGIEILKKPLENNLQIVSNVNEKIISCDQRVIPITSEDQLTESYEFKVFGSKTINLSYDDLYERLKRKDFNYIPLSKNKIEERDLYSANKIKYFYYDEEPGEAFVDDNIFRKFYIIRRMDFESSNFYFVPK